VLSRAAGRFADLCDWVDQVAAYIAAVGLVLMAAILVTEVLMRLFITRSTLVADEIASYMLAFVSFMALGHTLRHGAHLKVQLISDRLSATARKRLELALLPIAILSMGLFLVWLFRFVMQSYAYQIDSQSQLETPLWIPQAALCVGVFVFLLSLISRLIRILRGEIAP
jgi:TRAP-type C4-dicarboxylate transport system permease small subunit